MTMSSGAAAPTPDPAAVCYSPGSTDLLGLKLGGEAVAGSLRTTWQRLVSRLQCLQACSGCLPRPPSASFCALASALHASCRTDISTDLPPVQPLLLLPRALLKGLLRAPDLCGRSGADDR